MDRRLEQILLRRSPPAAAFGTPAMRLVEQELFDAETRLTRALDERLGPLEIVDGVIRTVEAMPVGDAELVGGYASSRIQSDACSAIMMQVRLMLARGMVGITDASTTRKFSTPRTRQCWSVTASGSPAGPIRAVPQG